MGVKQGEPLLHLLFLVFIIDIVQNLLVNDSYKQDYEEINRSFRYLLLFADDIVLFERHPDALQDLLNKPLCDKWEIQVNENKGEIVVFRKGWQIANS